MDTLTLTIFWILVVGVAVGLVAWLGPRPSQWRSHSEAKGSPDKERPADKQS